MPTSTCTRVSASFFAFFILRFASYSRDFFCPDPNYVPPSENDMVEDDDGEAPEVPLEELLDEMRLDDPTAYPDEEPDEEEDDGYQ